MMETQELDFRAQMAFEEALKPGDRIEARYTNSFTYYRRPVTVVRVNRASVRVREADGREYPIPRFTMTTVVRETWSHNNCVAPLPVSDA